MLRKRNLLICVVAVAFCLAAIESAEACDDWYWSVDCYEDYYSYPWMCCWDCYEYWLWWDYFGYSGYSDEPVMTIASDSQKAPQFPVPFDPDGGKEMVKVGNAVAHQEDAQNVR